ncbi:MAG: LacI family DNA-binding transcriptional regulator [Pseudomonadota bacterium]
MTRTTIPDIAAQSGLSTATVDRALNGRAGVSAINRHRVLETARQLGYLPHEGLLPMPARPARLAVLLPTPERAFLARLAEGISARAEAHPLVAACPIIPLSGIGPGALLAGIDALPPGTEAVGLVTTDHPKSRAAITRLAESGVKVVTLATDLSETKRAFYVGVDNRAAGRTAARILSLLAPEAGDVAVFAGSQAFLGHQEREMGFREVLEANSSLTVLPTVETMEDAARLRSEVAATLRQRPTLSAIYCLGAGRSGIIEALQGRVSRPVVVLHDLTPTSRRWLAEGRIDAIVDQNAELLAEQAILHLLGAVAGSPAALALKHVDARLILRENLPPDSRETRR